MILPMSDKYEYGISATNGCVYISGLLVEPLFYARMLMQT